MNCWGCIIICMPLIICIWRLHHALPADLAAGQRLEQMLVAALPSSFSSFARNAFTAGQSPSVTSRWKARSSRSNGSGFAASAPAACGCSRPAWTTTPFGPTRRTTRPRLHRLPGLLVLARVLRRFVQGNLARGGPGLEDRRGPAVERQLLDLLQPLLLLLLCSSAAFAASPAAGRRPRRAGPPRGRGAAGFWAGVSGVSGTIPVHWPCRAARAPAQTTATSSRCIPNLRMTCMAHTYLRDA